MGVPLLDSSRSHAAIADELRAEFESILESGMFILGPKVGEFECDMAGFNESKHAIGMSSGTDALIAAMMALDIEPGDEVIVPAFTFFATGGCVWRIGAKPVFVDIDPVTFNLDPAAVDAAITDRTRAIAPVHLYGQCADMDAIMAIAKKHDLHVIEDAAQAIGARFDGKRAGTFGDVGCISFYPTKNLGAFGDAGLCLTDSDELAKKMTIIRLHGQVDAYRHAVVGGNFRIDAFQAAVLRVKLRHLDAYNAARQAIAARYLDELADLPLSLPQTDERCEHVWHQFTVRAENRDALTEHLKSHGIGHKVYYPLPLHLQPCFAPLGYQRGDLPHCELAAEQVLSLPIFPDLTEAMQDEVITVIKRYYQG